ncbi:MAG TPA: winged helix-turn-helix domain-containing protein [Bryobacteraceae bacterium]|nr:winged helix-turn-helix domain-containing protein [Bryobacteraceae bacterium]
MHGRAGPKRQVYFSEFQLDLDTAELRNNGNKSSLVGQPLQILTELLERPGQLVTREELKKKLWPDDTFVDFDQSLNKAVNRLREALKDSAEHRRFIETLPRRGYRFIGSLNPAETVVHEPSEEAPVRVDRHKLTAPNRRHARRTAVVLGAGISVAVLLLAIAYHLGRPAMPRVIASTRLTDDGWRKFALVTDGVRLYFSERGTIVQSSVDGGEETEIHTGLSEVDIYDISPHGSALLVGAGTQSSPIAERPVWIISLPAGTPIQVGNITALHASWAPDGKHLAYSKNGGVYTAKTDGTEIRKLVNVAGPAWKVQYSPGGSRIRFNALDQTRNLPSIWEVATDGKNLHLVYPELTKPLNVGAWSADGKYFFFHSHDPQKDRNEDVWVSAEAGFVGARKAPVRLTHDAIVFGYPVPSPDGKKLYALGTQSRAELVRYDRDSKKFVPYLSGISAWETRISGDGQWVAYVSYPDLTLWRCSTDGTQRQQLTFPPLEVARPRWSPDGARLAFTDVRYGKIWKTYVISSTGGAPQQIMPDDTRAELDPSWSPDGTSIVFGGSVGDAKRGIHRLNLQTHAVSTVPGSEGLFSPQLSPNGRYIAAFPTDASKLMLYDLKTGEWQQTGGGTFQFNTWSRDGKSIYLLDASRGSRILRFDVAGGKLESIVSLKDVE